MWGSWFCVPFFVFNVGCTFGCIDGGCDARVKKGKRGRTNQGGFDSNVGDIFECENFNYRICYLTKLSMRGGFSSLFNSLFGKKIQRQLSDGPILFYPEDRRGMLERWPPWTVYEACRMTIHCMVYNMCLSVTCLFHSNDTLFDLVCLFFSIAVTNAAS